MTLLLEGVSYGYAAARSPALRGIDLELEPGSVLGVVGANDAGKSTLCLVAAGLAPAAIGGRLDGRVLVDDLDTSRARPYELAQRCGVLFQNPATQLSGTALTVWEEVAFGPRNLSLPLAEIVERVTAALRALSVADLAERDPQRLSGGQAQLVALAGVLALQPAYLVLDEPTSQLDPEGTRLVGDALELAARTTGAGIVIVEHKADLLARLADRVAVIDAGQIVASGPVEEILGDVRLEGWGIAPPSAVRLSRALDAEGLALPSEAA
jgi:energy-coupling factor transporter ATP-binding protein EcfA2